MTQLQPILNFILKHEDPSGRGEVTQDSGGITRWGIASVYNPGIDIANLPLSGPYPSAYAIYQAKYIDPFHLLELNSQEVASKIGDCLVNPGEGFARTVQEIAGVMQDGAIGPQTVSALNALIPDAVVEALCAAQAAHYRQEAVIAQNNGRAYPLAALLTRAADKPPEDAEDAEDADFFA